MSGATELQGLSGRPIQHGEPAWDIALLYPRQGDWSEAEYLALDSNRFVEFVDGCIEVLPMPSHVHQFISRILFRLFDAWIQAHQDGEMFYGPYPVRLRPGAFREPDLVYLRRQHVPNPGEVAEGADLAVEIVRPGTENRRRDLETKREEYAQARIGEYWIVDPQSRQITVLILDGEQYREHGVFGEGDTATSVLFDGFAVSVGEIFADCQE